MLGVFGLSLGPVTCYQEGSVGRGNYYTWKEAEIAYYMESHGRRDLGVYIYEKQY
jgi:hypothetical protein